ncbi:MAG: [protein-PII] uridylyltransferase [Gammaproteobacteria bacterium]
MENIIIDNSLFHEKAFQSELKTTKEPLLLFKKTLRKGYQSLIGRFTPGKNIELIVKQQTWLVDKLLIHAWQRFFKNDGLCLVAVGGYGRAELLLKSDIDLMILVKPRMKIQYKEQLETFLTFLWDFGLEVGHSVRTTKECQYEANKDITTMTNVMEARFIAGDSILFKEMCNLTSTKKIWPTRKFFEEKLSEQKQRHKIFNDTACKLEPNVKESPGGLRDIQMIGWVAKRHFDNIDLKNLVKHKFITSHEYEILRKGRNLLWGVRFGLHMLTRRREDRLLFENQRNIAELFGFKDKGNKGIEDFMKMYFKTIREIGHLNEILLQNLQEEIIFKKSRNKIVRINSRFQKRNNLIEVSNKNIFKKYPYALFEIFLLLQQDPSINAISASTIRLIRKNVYLIDNNFRNNLISKSLFLEIIRQPNLVGHKLRLMHKYGVLGAYMPSFSKIEGLMQFDLFHVFTVDEHILMVIKNLRLFGNEEYKNKYPIFYSLIKTIPKLELLYLAGLFHDIAKGRKGNHSKLGSKDALDFCEKHGLSEYDKKLVAWLVDKHLLMSKTSQREDLDDPEVISNFSKKMGDQTHLNHLYLLTIADMCATNPELWNSWKASLMSTLYYKTLQHLRRGSEKPLLKTARIKNTKQDTLNLLNNNINENNVYKIWKSINEDYFLRHNPDEIAWHTKGILEHDNSTKPLVMIDKNSSRGGSLIFVYMKDKKNIFAMITKAIANIGLTILDARIITNHENYTFDTFIVLETDGKPINSKSRCNEIKNKIINELSSSRRFQAKSMLIQKRQLKSFLIPTQVFFDTDKKNNRTIMEVITVDRPGILSHIGAAMELCGIKLQGAKIATFGERVEDIFYLQNYENKAISDPLKFECLEKSIIETLS